MSARELFALATSAKNSTHQVRGYSPNQWAFGANHNRISSFLENGDHLPWLSQCEVPDFEEAMKQEVLSKRLFLEADSRRRLYRALRAQSRPLRLFETGTLVYYYRRSRKEVTKHGGRWFGPARVLCHEMSSDSDDIAHPGSIVWISHAGILLRCSPEQLRVVTRDVQEIDLEINGQSDFHTLMEQVARQRKFVDLTVEHAQQEVEQEQLDENVPRYRCQRKRALDPATDLPSDVLPDGVFEDPGAGVEDESRESRRPRGPKAL